MIEVDDLGDLVVDLFRGPGGWSEGLKALGLGDIGIEWDELACRTGVAAGHLTLRADVAMYPTEPFRGRVRGLIASPPCQAFSVAGKQKGRPTAFLAALEGRYDSAAVRADIARQKAVHARWCAARDELVDRNPTWVLSRVIEISAGETVTEEYLSAHGAQEVAKRIGPEPEVEDERGMFMAEAVRWADDLRPEWIACEQVPPGLDMWRLFARWLEDRGYHAWCGVLNAADYGVPQTRRRAILMASRRKRVGPPPPTHCDQRRSPSLFLLPWVSMAQALGWDGAVRTNSGNGYAHDYERDPDRPSPTVNSRGNRWEVETRGDRTTPGGNEFDADGPSWALTEKSRSWKVRTGQNTTLGDGITERYERSIDEPAPTLDTKVGRAWTVVQDGDDDAAVVRDPESTVVRHSFAETSPDSWTDHRVPATQPAPTVDTKARAWAWETPATTIAGDPRITSRCHHDEVSQGRAPKSTEQVRVGDYEGTEPIKLTITEALILQGFPPDYPVQGSRTAQFRQVGDAVPPPLAEAVLRCLVG